MSGTGLEMVDGFDSLFSTETWIGIGKNTFQLIQSFVLRLFFALIILFIGWIIIKIIMCIVRKAFSMKDNLDTKTHGRFMLSCLKAVLWFMVITAFLNALGFDMLALALLGGAVSVAVLAGVGSAAGNFIAGIQLIMTKPFVKGELIEAQGVLGVVDIVELTTTRLLTLDNKTAIVPNKALANNTVVNYSRDEKRRVDLTFGVAYDANLKEARSILTKLVKRHPLILAEPACVINVHELADNSVNFICRPWVKQADYWTVHWDLNLSAKLAFDKANIGIPFPQLDAWVHKDAGVPDLKKTL